MDKEKAIFIIYIIYNEVLLNQKEETNWLFAGKWTELQVMVSK